MVNGTSGLITGLASHAIHLEDPNRSADLTAKVEAVFATTDLLDASNLVVTSQAPSINLEGTVPAFDERELASRIHGVQEIENRMGGITAKDYDLLLQGLRRTRPRAHSCVT